jgi:hypothetical protein
MRFDQLLEAVEKLPPEDQESLIMLIQRRRLARQRAQLAKDIAEARQEFQAGGCQPETPDALMREILS